MKKEPIIFFIMEWVLTVILTFRWIAPVTEYVIKTSSEQIGTREVFLMQLIFAGLMYLASSIIVLAIKWSYYHAKADTVLRKRHKQFFRKYDEDALALARGFWK